MSLSQSNLVTYWGNLNWMGRLQDGLEELAVSLGSKVIQHLCVCSWLFLLFVFCDGGQLQILRVHIGLIVLIICSSVTWIMGHRTKHTVSKLGVRRRGEQKLGKVGSTLEGRAKAAHQRGKSLERWRNRNLMKCNNSQDLPGTERTSCSSTG